MITIKQPRIEYGDYKDRVISEIIVDDDAVPVWFEVSKEYGKYLTYERSDGFLIGMLSYAMRKKHDIKCEAPVTEELLYKICTILIPSLAKYGKDLYRTKIIAETAPALDNAGAVGSGLSCGVDSMHVIAKCTHSEYNSMNLTHFTFYNVGSFNGIYKEAGIEKVRDVCRERAERCAEEMNLPLIITDSNFQSAFWQNHLLTHTFSSTFAIFMLQKLWKTYYYGSSGYDYSLFTIKNNDCISADHYDLLSLFCFSTSKMTIYSEGGEETRYEKQLDIADNPIAQKYLHVCTKDYNNCNTCNKCKRTLLLFDAMGKLDSFSNVFDINYYREHRIDYLDYLYRAHKKEIDDPMLEPAYQKLKNDPEMTLVIKRYTGKKRGSEFTYKEAYEQAINSYNYRTGEFLLRVPKKIYKAIKKDR